MTRAPKKQQPVSRKFRGAKRAVRFDGPRLKKARLAKDLRQEDMVGPGLSLSGIQRAERGRPVSHDTAVSICLIIGINMVEYVVPEEEEDITLVPIPSDSRIITGDMIVFRGNYIDGTPFAFEAALNLRALTTGDILKFECILYRERVVTQFPPGKTGDDYTEKALAPERQGFFI